MSVCVFVCVCVYVCVYVYVCVSMCLSVCVSVCIRFWHFLKVTFIEVTGFILGSLKLSVIFYSTLHNISVKRTFILRVGQTGRMQCPFLQK
jgi:hypothetical protein